MTTQANKVAIVTGASGGIGAEPVQQHDECRRRPFGGRPARPVERRCLTHRRRPAIP
jgi:hypothetical protein